MTVVMVSVFAVLLLLAFPVGYALVISSGAAVLTMGAVPTVTPALSDEVATLIGWADELRWLGGGADTPLP